MPKQNDNNFNQVIIFWQNLKSSLFLFHSLFGGIVLPLLVLPIFFLALDKVDPAIYPFMFLGNLLLLIPFYFISAWLIKLKKTRVFVFIFLIINLVLILVVINLPKFLALHEAYAISSLIILPLWFFWKQVSVLFYSPVIIGKHKELKEKRIFLFSRIMMMLGIALAILFVGIFKHIEQLLYVALFFHLSLFIFTIKKYPNPENEKQTVFGKTESKKRILKNPFNRSLFSVFIIAIYIFIASFSFFLYTFRTNYPLLGKDWQIFIYFSLYFFFVFLFVNVLRENAKKLINRVGISFSMQLYPVIIFVFTLLSLLITYGLGLSNYLSLFIVSSVLFFEIILRSGLFYLSLQVILKTIHQNVYQFIAKVLPLVFILVLVFLLFVEAIVWLLNLDLNQQAYFMAWLLAFFSVLQFVFSYRTYKIHRAELVGKALEKQHFSESSDKDEIYGTDILLQKLNSKDIEEVKLSVIILSEINAKKLAPYIESLLSKNCLMINKAIVSNIDYSFDKQLVSLVVERIHIKDAELEEKLTQIKDYVLENNVPLLDDDFMSKLALLKKVKENPKLLSLRVGFLPEDEHPFLIKSFIGIISDQKNPMALEALAHWLIHEKYRHYVADYLIGIGDEVLPLIDNYFYHSNPPVELLIKIIEIYGKIGSNYAIDYLVSHFNFPDTYIQNMIIKSLIHINYKPSEENEKVFVRKIYYIVQNITWLLNYRENFLQDAKVLAIIPALDSEIKLKTESLFMLMELLFNRAQILLARNNFEKGNNIYAAELLSGILTEDLKNIVLPIVENIPNYQKIRRLGQYFSVENLHSVEQLIQLIKASPLKISDSTRAKAIEVLSVLFRKNKFNKWKISYSNFQVIEWTEDSIEKALKDISISNVPDEAFLGLFHQSPLVYTTAASILFNINPARTAYFLKNFNDERHDLLNILENSKGQSDGTILEKMKYLKRLKEFENVKVDILLYLASNIEIEDVMQGVYVSFYRNEHEDIMWLLIGELQDDASGQIFTKNSILISGLNAPLSALKVVKSAKLLRSNRSKYFSTLVIHEDLIKNIFKNLFH